jgi:methyl-accepting chemotaxis protein
MGANGKMQAGAGHDFAGLDDANYAAFPAVLSAVEKHAPDALDLLYRQIDATPETRRFFASPAAASHAKAKQLDHWRELFARPLDDQYRQRANRIGQIHAEIGLEPSWYIRSYALLLERVVDGIVNEGLVARFNGGRLSAQIGTLIKAAMADMDIALSAYFHVESQRRTAVIDRVGAALDALARGDFTARLEGLPDAYAKLISRRCDRALPRRSARWRARPAVSAPDRRRSARRRTTSPAAPSSRRPAWRRPRRR